MYQCHVLKRKFECVFFFLLLNNMDFMDKKGLACVDLSDPQSIMEQVSVLFECAGIISMPFRALAPLP